MRYYFYIRTREGLIPDSDGAELPSADAARSEALLDARELAREFPTGGNGVSLLAIEVMDEAGRMTCQLPIYAADFPP